MASTTQSTLFMLPNEVICIIILHLVKAQFPDKHMEGLMSLSLVCSRLHDIVDKTPGLWAYIRLRDPFQVKSQLQKSLQSPLHIYASSISGSSNGTEIIRLISFEVHRWQFLELEHLYIPQSIQLAHAFENQAPLLELCHIGGSSLILGEDLFQGYAPKLRHLDIVSRMSTWDIGLMKGLRFLRMCWWVDDRRDCQGYISMLKNCPNLEVLRLHGDGGHTASVLEAFCVDIHLPRLLELSLIRLQAMIVRSLLSSIKAPPNVRLLNIELPPTSNSFFNEMWFGSALGRVPMESPFGVLLAHPTVVIDKSGGRRGEWSRFEVYSTAENSPPTGEHAEIGRC